MESSDKSDPSVDSGLSDVIAQHGDVNSIVFSGQHPSLDSESTDCKSDTLLGQDTSFDSESLNIVVIKNDNIKPVVLSGQHSSLNSGSEDFAVPKLEDCKPDALTDQNAAFDSESPNIAVTKYDDCNSEGLASQEAIVGEQEQVLAYVDLQNLNLNGAQIYLQNIDGEMCYLVVNNDQDGQPLDPSIFASGSVIHASNISFETGNDVTVTGDGVQDLQFIKTNDMPDHEGRHVYTENTNISNAHNSEESSSAEQPLWSNTIQVKDNSAEMVFIPSQTIPRNKKLIQLANIAYELSTDDKTVPAPEQIIKHGHIEDEFDNSVISTQYDRDSHDSLLLASDTTKKSQSIADEVLESNSSPVESAENLSVFLSSTTQSVDNTVSVIHATSDHQEDSVKGTFVGDSESAKNYENQGEISSDVLSPSVSKIPQVDEDESSFSTQNDKMDDDSENRLCIDSNSNDSMTMINSPSKNDITINSPSKNDSNIDFTSKNDSNIDFTSKNDSTIDSSSKNDSTIDFSSKNDSPVDSFSKNGSTIDFSSKNDSPADSPSKNDPIIDSPSKKYSTIDSPTKNDLTIEALNKKDSIMNIPVDICTDLPTSFNQNSNDEKESNEVKKFNNEDSVVSAEVSSNNCDYATVEEKSNKGNEKCNLFSTSKSDNFNQDESLDLSTKYIKKSRRKFFKKKFAVELPQVPSTLESDSDSEALHIVEHTEESASKPQFSFATSKKKSFVNSKFKNPLLTSTDSKDIKASSTNKSNDDISKQDTSVDSYKFDTKDSNITEVEKFISAVGDSEKSNVAVSSINNLSENVSFRGVFEKKSMDIENNDSFKSSSADNAETQNSESISSEIISSEHVPVELETKSNKNVDSSASERNVVEDMNLELETKSNERADSSATERNVVEDMNLELETKSNKKADSSSIERSVVDDMNFDATEETLVKPPKKTYIRKKKVQGRYLDNNQMDLFSSDINFTECDKDLSDIQDSLNADKKLKTSSSKESPNSNLPISSMKSKVSTLYSRKRKIGMPVTQSRSLRPRSITSNQTLENGTRDNSSGDKKDSYDSSNSENIPWGDVLMNTSFQKTENAEDIPSTSYAAPSSPKESTPKKKRKSNKPKHDWETFVKSSPDKLKRQGSNRRQSLQAKVKKQALSKLNSKRFFQQFDSITFARGRGRPRKEINERINSDVKRANITYKDQSGPVENSGNVVRPLNYCCSSCNFASCKVNNLIEHLKYCTKRQPPIDYRVDDMDRRQRIRGEEIENIRTPQGLTNFINGALNEIRDISEAECSGLSQGQMLDSDEDMDLDFMENKSQFGYSEDDVVWARVENRFWPALVCELTKRMVSVKLINYPTEKQGLKISAERVHTFNDAKWNKMLLAEAASLPDNETFVKAVQTSETFVRKKWLGLNVKGKDFFSIPDHVDFVTDTESSKTMDHDLPADTSSLKIPPSRAARYSKLDSEKIKNYILEGHLDEYVLDIFHRKENRKKHFKYFSESRSVSDLKGKMWFGPLEKVCEQGILIQHFRKVFERNIGKKHFMISYICEVWIPEAIVKAISLIENIPLKAAESIFESDDSLESDLSPDELLKMHS